MNVTHVNKFWGKKIVEWCIDNLGESKYQDTPPRIILYNRNNKIYGYYNEEKNIIVIYLKKHKSFKSFIGTIIHEYTHHLQNIEGKYYKILKKSGYKKHPFEIEAYNNELKYVRECKDYLKSLA